MTRFPHFQRLISAALVFCLLAAFAPATHAIDAQLTAHSASDETGELGYLLYTPTNAQADMSLIVYLHGGSARGDDLSLLTQGDGFPRYLQDGRLGKPTAYVLIPQLPSDKTSWSDASDTLYALIDAIAAQYSIDRSNISLTGHSMGGTGTWAIAAKYPSLFARIAPLSGSIRNTAENQKALAHTSVWAFVGAKDTLVNPTSSTEFVQQLISINNDVRLTSFADAGHFDVPALAYLDDELGLLDWLTGKTNTESDDETVHLCAAYTDIPSDWSQPGICYVIEHGLMNGIDAHTFSPAQSMNRAMAVTVLYRLAGSPQTDAETSFVDIPENAYYAQAVRWAQQNGIAYGTNSTHFTPNASITREQLATFFFRYAAETGLDTSGRADLTAFSDANTVSDYAMDAMRWCVQSGLIQGTGSDALSPKMTATRAQIAAVLMRFSESAA